MSAMRSIMPPLISVVFFEPRNNADQPCKASTILVSERGGSYSQSLVVQKQKTTASL